MNNIIIILIILVIISQFNFLILTVLGLVTYIKLNKRNTYDDISDIKIHKILSKKDKYEEKTISAADTISTTQFDNIKPVNFGKEE